MMTTAPEAMGRPISRVEGFDKVTGKAQYTADVVLPELAHAVLVQTEIPHGHVTEESLRTAADVVGDAPGVLHVLTPLNCPHLRALPRDLTFDLPLERRPPLSDLTVQHVGQHLAMVVADTLENAVAAASLFTVTYETAPAQLNAHAVVEQPTAPDEKDGQIRHGSYLPDHFVKLDEEKLQDHRGQPHPQAPTPSASTRTTRHRRMRTTPSNSRRPSPTGTATTSTFTTAPGGSPASGPHWPLTSTCRRITSASSHHWWAAPSDRRASCGCTSCCARSLREPWIGR